MSSFLSSLSSSSSFLPNTYFFFLSFFSCSVIFIFFLLFLFLPTLFFYSLFFLFSFFTLIFLLQHFFFLITTPSLHPSFHFTLLPLLPPRPPLNFLELSLYFLYSKFPHHLLLALIFPPGLLANLLFNFLVLFFSVLRLQTERRDEEWNGDSRRE